MIIALNTATNITELILFDVDGHIVKNDSWESGRQLSSQLLDHLEGLLRNQQATWKDVRGIIVFRGPGSFTGLRIGITVANTISYAQSVPVVGEIGDHWTHKGLKRLAHKHNDHQVLPHYGAPATITKPRGMA